LAAKQHAGPWWNRLVAPMEEEEAAATARGSARDGDAWLWNAAMVLTAAPPGADARAATMAAMPLPLLLTDGRLILWRNPGVVAANILGESRCRR
jgi:hypothetical protein